MSAPPDRPRTELPPFDRLPAHDHGSLLAVIEATRGSRNKLKHEPRWNAFVLDGLLPPGLAWPLDFGFVPSTLGEDGDPLDVLVLADEPVPAGIVVPCRLLGLIEAEQQDQGDAAVRNDRLVAVALESRRHEACRELADLPSHLLPELERFFVALNAERGGRFTVLARRGIAAAERAVRVGEQAFGRRLGTDAD